MTSPRFFLLLSLLIASVLSGCQPELGQCDPDSARALYYDEGGNPAYGGQALLDVGCAAGGNYCHAPAASGPTRFGAPASYDLDVRLAATPEALERLRDGHERVLGDAALIWGEVESGRMPPPEPARSEALEGGPSYVSADGGALPAIGTPEADAMLRNWLACDAPVVEATAGPSAGIGDIVEPAGLSCPEGQAECTAGVCQDVMNDPRNCGACGNDCGALFCSAGACVESCPADRLECSGSCVDPQTSDSHCGSCGNACPAGQLCTAGSCACAPGTEDCGGSCVDVSSDRDNCGGCGVTCATGESCEGGACVACGPAADFSAEVQPIFDRSCATTGCHTGRRPSANLSLDAGASHGELVGVSANALACSSETRVVPFDPAASYLMKKLLGTASCGVQMPRRGESLPAGELDLIRGWICRGAAND